MATTTPAPAPTPTARQAEILRLLSQGKTQTEMTTLLGLKDSGLQSHLARMKKAGLLDKTGAPAPGVLNNATAVDLSGTGENGGGPAAEVEAPAEAPPEVPTSAAIEANLRRTVADIESTIAHNTSQVESHRSTIEVLEKEIEGLENDTHDLQSKRDGIVALLGVESEAEETKETAPVKS